MKLLPFYEKYIKPFIALMILVMLIFTVTLLRNEQKLKDEISENCGWGEEDYRCFCEKSEAMALQNKMEVLTGVPYVQLDR